MPLMMPESDPVTAMPGMNSVFFLGSNISFGDLSLSFSFPPVEEHRQTLEGEESEEIVEPLASKSFIESLAASI